MLVTRSIAASSGAFSISSAGVEHYSGILRKKSPAEFLLQRVSLFRLFYQPGNQEVVEEDGNAWLVGPGDVTGLADALERLLSDDDTRRRFGHRSSAIFEERFTLRSSANRMAAPYHDLHGRHG